METRASCLAVGTHDVVYLSRFKVVMSLVYSDAGARDDCFRRESRSWFDLLFLHVVGRDAGLGVLLQHVTRAASTAE